MFLRKILAFGLGDCNYFGGILLSSHSLSVLLQKQVELLEPINQAGNLNMRHYQCHTLIPVSDTGLL